MARNYSHRALCLDMGAAFASLLSGRSLSEELKTGPSLVRGLQSHLDTAPAPSTLASILSPSVQMLRQHLSTGLSEGDVPILRQIRKRVVSLMAPLPNDLNRDVRVFQRAIGISTLWLPPSSSVFTIS